MLFSRSITRSVDVPDDTAAAAASASCAAFFDSCLQRLAAVALIVFFSFCLFVSVGAFSRIVFSLLVPCFAEDSYSVFLPLVPEGAIASSFLIYFDSSLALQDVCAGSNNDLICVLF